MEKKAYKTPSIRVKRMQPMRMIAGSAKVNNEEHNNISAGSNERRRSIWDYGEE